jgi:reactive intermediate/imine deaminase
MVMFVATYRFELNPKPRQEYTGMSRKQVIGGPLEIGGRVLSLSRAIRAGDFVFVTGQVPMRDGVPVTDGTIEEQTRACIDSLRDILAEAGCELGDVVKSMVWLRRREDFAGFDSVYAEYFAEEPPTRSALVSDFLIDILVEIECIAYRPL